VSQILPLIARPEEKRLAIAALGSLPCRGALETLTTFAADPAVAEEACSAIVNLAGRNDLKDVAKDLRQQALRTAAQKAATGATRTRAEQMLKAGQ
jgi:hypothetical protein